MPRQLRGAFLTLDPTGRFSDRAEDYDRYRPGYPAALIDAIAELGVVAPAPVADIGSGTGIFSRLLLDAGYRVFAVEPNAAMRARAEAALGDREGFTSVDGTAEATGLESGSVAAITCAQSFHWFDPGPTRVEMARIAREGAVVALIWNDRRPDASELMAAYEALLERFGTDFRATSERYEQTRAAARSFLDGPVRELSIETRQRLDAAGLIGRFFSSSFTPPPGTEAREQAREAVSELFERNQQNGQVELVYTTRAYLGRPRTGSLEFA